MWENKDVRGVGWQEWFSIVGKIMLHDLVDFYRYFTPTRFETLELGEGDTLWGRWCRCGSGGALIHSLSVFCFQPELSNEPGCLDFGGRTSSRDAWMDLIIVLHLCRESFVVWSAVDADSRDSIKTASSAFSRMISMRKFKPIFSRRFCSKPSNTEFILYTRKYCGLCEEAEEAINLALSLFPHLTLKKIDIDSGMENKRKYLKYT
jgi:hypothetical protein